MKYEEFLQSKMITSVPSGFDVDDSTLPANLYHYQRDLVKWACRRGKAALFTMTGTGKTAMQSSWADQVHRHTCGNVIIAAPLSVAKQTVKEAAKFGIKVKYVRDPSEVEPGISIVNYDMLHHFTDLPWAGIVLDESSILKNFSGKLRNFIIQFAQNIPYRLACSATPSPNDFMEIGNHAEFLGVMTYTEMLATFFVHDGGDTSKWRLKGHAEEKFWSWLAEWGVFLVRPSDLGYSDEGFDLPALNTFQHVVESGATEGALFAFEAHGLQERRSARRESLVRRVAMCHSIVMASIIKDPAAKWSIWCDLNDEQDALESIFGDLCVSIRGNTPDAKREELEELWRLGNKNCIITKGSIFGWGMNWQHCHNMAFVGMSDSFEMIFQISKRHHRHGQKHEVNRHMIISEAEGDVARNVARKETDFMTMITNMVQHTRNITMENIKSMHRQQDEYNASQHIIIPGWLIGGQLG